jgi:hypothetical protein
LLEGKVKKVHQTVLWKALKATVCVRKVEKGTFPKVFQLRLQVLMTLSGVVNEQAWSSASIAVPLLCLSLLNNFVPELVLEECQSYQTYLSSPFYFSFSFCLSGSLSSLLKQRGKGSVKFKFNRT